MPKTLIPSTPSTIGSWARFIARGLDGCGLDGRQVFLDEGINLDESDAPNTRFPVATMSRAWERAVELTGDQGFALTLTDYADPGMYNALGLSMLSSNNLGEAIRRSCLFSQVATDAGYQSLRERDDGLMELIQHISIPWDYPLTVYSVEAFSATFVKILRNISRERFKLREVHYRHNKEPLRQRYEDFYKAPMVFGSDDYKLVFERRMLDLPCDQANPALAENIDHWMRDYLASFQQDTLAQQVRCLLAEKLPDGEHMQDAVASALAMSTRSLQRGLQQEGVSFKSLLEQTRKDLAIRYIGEPALSLIEVCCLLGFADQSNFTKAFKRWTGKTPRGYRLELIG